MLFFRKTDEQELDRLLKLEKKDRTRLAEMEAKFRALKPRWSEIQNEAERLASMYESNDRTYSREVCETFWADRGPELKRQIERLVAQRDQLTGGIEKQIRDIKNALHWRREAVVSEFSGWVGQVSAQLPPALASELAVIRANAQRSEDLGAIVASFGEAVERVAEVDSVRVTLLNLAAVVRNALAIAAPTGDAAANN